MSPVRSILTGAALEEGALIPCGLTTATAPVRVGGEAIEQGTPIIGVPGLRVELYDGQDWLLVEVTQTPDPTRPDARRLRELGSLSATPFDLLRKECPVTITAGKDADSLPCEEELSERYEHLAQASAHPQSRLTSRDEVVALQRARRINARGLTWLAGHPGAWAGRRGSMPIPERVLAEQPELLVDIYENRVLATVVDRINVHLRNRIRDLEQTQERFEERRSLSEDAAWSVRSRIARLWSEAWVGEDDVDATDEAVGRRLEMLRDRHRRVRALRQRPGYASVVRQHRGVRSLRQTNIFRGDDRYQQVARLWRAFGADRVETPRQRVDQQLKTHDGHGVFVRLLVLRAIEECLAGDLLDPLGDGPERAVVARRDGSVEVNAHGAPPLRVIPLFCAAAPSQIGSMLGRQEEHVLAVLQPPGDGASLPPWRSPDDQLLVVAESPTHLGAVETVGALLREHVLGARYTALPPRLRIPRELLPRFAEAAIKIDSTGARSSGPECEVTVLVAPGEAAIERLHEIWVPPNLRGAGRQSRERRWVSIQNELSLAARAFSLAIPCPTPHCAGRGRAKAERDRVVLECTACSCRWGMQLCPAGHRVPFALTPQEAEPIEILEATLDDAYRLAGMQLVLPVAFHDGRLGTACPICKAWTILPVASDDR